MSDVNLQSKEDGEVSGGSDSETDKKKIDATTRKRHRHESSSSTNSSGSNSSSCSSSSNSSSQTSSSSSSSNSEEVKAKRIKIMNPKSAANLVQPTSSTTQKAKEPETVAQYLMRNLAIANENDLLYAMRQTPDIAGQLIHGKHVAANYTKVPVNFVVSGITQSSAERQPAFFRGPAVAKYIQQKQNITLKHPEWPCVIQRGGGNHQSFYPIELLFIS